MIDFLDSVTLTSIQPNKHIVDFYREKIIGVGADVSLSIKAELSEPVEGSDSEKIKLTISVNGKVTSEEHNEQLFKIIFAVDYIFNISNKAKFEELTQEEQLHLCTLNSYLDFRSKFHIAINSIGLNKVRLPLCIKDLIDEQ